MKESNLICLRYSPRICSEDQEDLDSIHKLLAGKGYVMDNDNLYMAWGAFSASCAAGWLMPDYSWVNMFIEFLER